MQVFDWAAAESLIVTIEGSYSPYNIFQITHVWQK